MKASEKRYRDLLNGFDWYYNYSDDYSVWAKGKKRSDELWGLQPDVDPDFAIYNQFAPDEFKQTKK